MPLLPPLSYLAGPLQPETLALLSSPSYAAAYPLLSTSISSVFPPTETTGETSPAPATPVPSKASGGAPKCRLHVGIDCVRGIEARNATPVGIVLVFTAAGGPPPRNSGDPDLPRAGQLLRRPPGEPTLPFPLSPLRFAVRMVESVPASSGPPLLAARSSARTALVLHRCVLSSHTHPSHTPRTQTVPYTPSRPLPPWNGRRRRDSARHCSLYPVFSFRQCPWL